MALEKFASSQMRRQPPQPYVDPALTQDGDAEPSALERILELNTEAIETSRLANILGRMPASFITLFLGTAAIAALEIRNAAIAPLGIWSLFVLIAVGAGLRLYVKAMRAPFELTSLRAFAADFNAVQLYAGFAWGAGAFLALPAQSGIVALTLFSAGAVFVQGVCLKARAPVLYFLAPAMGLPMVAAFFHASGPGLAASGFILALAGLLAVAAELTERWTSKRLGTEPLSMLILS